MITLIIIAWLLSGALGWWLILRYYLKILRLGDLSLLVLDLAMGPIILLVAVLLLLDGRGSTIIKSWR